MLGEWEDTEKILIAVGQYGPDSELGGTLTKVMDEFHIPVIGESLANLPIHELSVSHQDLFLSDSDQITFQPELLITFGQSFVSKNFKNFIRKHPPRQHWHISEDRRVIDPFQTVTRQIGVAPEYFFAKLFEDVDYLRFVQQDDGGQYEGFAATWIRAERRVKGTLARYFENLTACLLYTSRCV